MNYRLAEGVRIEPLDKAWVSFSELSGETALLNTEAVAVLELLVSGPQDSAQVARALATESRTDVARVNEALRHIWDQLLSAGLVEIAEVSDHNLG